MIGKEPINQASRPLQVGQLPHPLHVSGALRIEVALGGTAQHQRQHDLGEQDGLQVRLRLNRLPEPRLDLVDAEVGDRIPLAVRPGARLGIPGYNLAIAREAAERGVDLAERQRPAPAEVGVIVALEVISVARLSLEQAKEG